MAPNCSSVTASPWCLSWINNSPLPGEADDSEAYINTAQQQLQYEKRTMKHKSQRRVKCDEGRPSCARCIKAGKDCAGYEPWRPLPPSTQSQSPISLSIRQAANAEEDLYFRIFVEDGGKQSVAPSDVQFWKVLVPQLCETEPSIRYAAVAIGALMMQQRFLKGFSDSGPQSKSALVYYNKSIQQLLSTSTPVSKDAALISNILFTCLECIQGHDSQALGLFHQGRRMFEEHWDSGHQASVIMSSVRSMLSRLRLVALLYGPPMADYRSPITGEEARTPPGEAFTSFEEARLAFFYLTGDAHDFLGEAARAKLAHIPPAAIARTFSTEQEVIRGKLRAWKERFTPLLEPALHKRDDPSGQIAVLTLQCHHTIMQVWVTCCLDAGEMAYDMHLASFQKIVDISKRVLDLLETSGLTSQPFSLEIGLIAPLYLSGRLCHDLTLRRECIKLLRRGRQQENLWESKLCVAVLERVVEIEEGGRLPAQLALPTSARLRATFVHPRKTSVQGERGNVVQFFLPPKDSEQCWEVWEEWFKA